MRKDEYIFKRMLAIWGGKFLNTYHNDDLKAMFMAELLVSFDGMDKEQVDLMINNARDNHDSTFAPSISELRSYIVTRGNKESDAMNAFNHALEKANIYEAPNFDDPRISIVISELGGWIRFCKLHDQELIFYKKDFLRIYQDISDQEVKKRKIPRLRSVLDEDKPKVLRIDSDNSPKLVPNLSDQGSTGKNGLVLRNN